MPRFFDPQPNTRHRLGVVPHRFNLEEARKALGGHSHVKVIDVQEPVEVVISGICSCERLASSSLHGLIIGHSYGIPSVWAEFERPLDGDGVKFNDYFASIPTTDPPGPVVPYKMTGATRTEDVEAAVDDCPQPRDLEPLRDRLMAVCPFPRLHP